MSQGERKEAIEDLCSLASQGYTILYRPGEKPVKGLCPVAGCGQTIIKNDLRIYTAYGKLTVAVYRNPTGIPIFIGVAKRSWPTHWSDRPLS